MLYNSAKIAELTFFVSGNVLFVISFSLSVGQENKEIYPKHFSAWKHSS